jgi:Holliday junction resolvase RusA-like endonuclease
MDEEAPIVFSVRGMCPKPWGTMEWTWRKLIAEKARKLRASVGTTIGQRFRVRIVFFLPSAALERADLDNLAKPVLDTLFRATHAQAPVDGVTGILFDIDDGRVFELDLEKQAASSTALEGIDVQITWY